MIGGISIEVKGSITAAFNGELDRFKRGVSKAVKMAGEGLRFDLKDHTSGRNLGKLAMAWSILTYPRRPSLHAAALIYADGEGANKALWSFEHGAVIKSGKSRYLAIPLGANVPRGYRGVRRPLVSTAEMAQSKMSFVLDGKNGTKLWCVRVVTGLARSKKTGEVMKRAFAGHFFVKNARGGGRLMLLGSGRRKRTEEWLKKGYVPMFLLVPQVTVRKRLDLKGQVDRWRSRLAAMIEAGMQ